MVQRLPEKEIDRPLGLGNARPSRTRFGSTQLGTALAAVAILGASSYIALQPKPFRTPQQVVVSTPEIVPTLRTSTEAPAPTPTTSSGPQILRVQPSSDSATGPIIVRDPTSNKGQDLRVAHLPDRDLVEQTETGLLPVRAADGRRPFDVYARPWSGTRGARVAIVIGGLGVSQTGTQAAISKLPPEVTLAFASGGNSLDRWMSQARQKGHEIVMQVPLEPFDYPNVDPGRNTLTVDTNASENLNRLYASLSRITNYTGVMNYMGGAFVADRVALTPFLDDLGKRGLMYLDDGSSARTLVPELASAARIPYAASDMTIDTDRDRGSILKKLDDAERTARAKGFAIATGSAFDVTIDAVTTWTQEASRRGIEIVPVSALADDPERP